MTAATKTTRRSTKEQTKARVAEIIRILLDGATGLEVVHFVREREAEQDSPWKPAEGQDALSYSRIRRYVEKAEKVIADITKDDRKKNVNRHLAQRRNLYAKAIAQGDIRCALSVLDSEARLLGLFPNPDPSTPRRGPATSSP